MHGKERGIRRISSYSRHAILRSLFPAEDHKACGHYRTPAQGAIRPLFIAADTRMCEKNTVFDGWREIVLLPMTRSAHGSDSAPHVVSQLPAENFTLWHQAKVSTIPVPADETGTWLTWMAGSAALPFWLAWRPF